MALREIIVFIYLPGEVSAVPAGMFTHDSATGVGTFAYGERYLQRSNAMPVDPVSLKLGITADAVVENSGLYGAFRDAAPDYWGRLVIASELNTVPETISEVDFLLKANATRVGNLDFRSSPDSPEPELAPPAYDQLANVIHGAEDIESGRPAEAHILHLLRQGSSMGGARPKCTIEWNDGLWIAKFPAQGDTVDIPAIEYATMRLAEECGIEIPEIKLRSIAGKNVFFIKRFDRAQSSEGWLRNGFISSLSLMRLDERDRLHWSYISVAGLMRQYCPAEDLRKLYQRMIFNIFVRNTDDHPRNHGFLATENGLRLSPAYDIVPSLTQAGVSTRFDLAMTVGKQGRNATVDNALSNCEQFGLSQKQAKKIIDEITGITRNWKKVFAECCVAEREIKLLEPSFSCLLAISI